VRATRQVLPPRMRIAIVNRQQRYAIRSKRLLPLMRFFLSQACRGRRRWCGNDVTLVITDDVGIRELNRRHLNSDEATDVIAFGYVALPGEDNRMACGDVVVNVERAFQEGRARGGLSREFALYMAHGCDHLAGEEDKTVRQRRRMLNRERRWLRLAAGQALLGPIPLATRRMRGAAVSRTPSP
jgi:rRNA maturation RNase YbeY